MDIVRKDLNLDNKQMVECFFKGTVIQIPAQLFHAMTIRTQFDNKKFVRYKEGAEMYSMGMTKFQELAKEARACYKVNQLVLVNLDILDEYLESFRITEETYYK